MASLRIRQRADGTTAYNVQWRLAGAQRTMTFDSRRDAENFRRTISVTKGDATQAGRMLRSEARDIPTMRVMAEHHVAGLASVSDRTRADYRRQIDKHITPDLGAIQVDLITPQHIRDWINGLSAGELSDKTISSLHGLLSAILATAVELGHRAENPCRGTRLPRRRQHERTQKQFLTPPEWAAIDQALAHIADGHYRLHFRVLAGTGMRWGELGGLQVRDLDLLTAPPSLHISRSLKRGPDGAMFIGPTKTSRSVRAIVLDDSLAEQLRTHVAGKAPGDQVFTAAKGGFIDQHHMLARIWKPAVKASGVFRQPRIHDLRHSHASWLIAAGVDLLTVQRRLGHESIVTTTSVYGHLLPGQQKAAADAIAAVMKTG